MRLQRAVEGPTEEQAASVRSCFRPLLLFFFFSISSGHDITVLCHIYCSLSKGPQAMPPNATQA